MQTPDSGPQSSNETPPEQKSDSEPPSTTTSQLSSDYDSSGASDGDDPNAEYVRLKLKYHEMQSVQRLKEGHPELRRLKVKIITVKGDLLFDERTAEREFLSQRAKMDRELLSSRLKAEQLRLPKMPKEKPVLKAKEVEVPNEDDEESFGLSDLMEPQPELTSTGRVILVREMGIPKQWSSRTPKALLGDCVKKLDKYAAISYSIISGQSRALRASVSIVWDGRKRDDWTMEEVGCPDEVQAEQYIATVALHALTYPSTDGFAAGNIMLGANHTFFRALPASFRDLWDELEAQRKVRDDTVNIDLWYKLRSLASAKLASSEKVRVSKIYLLLCLTDPTGFQFIYEGDGWTTGLWEV